MSNRQYHGICSALFIIAAGTFADTDENYSIVLLLVAVINGVIAVGETWRERKA